MAFGVWMNPEYWSAMSIAAALAALAFVLFLPSSNQLGQGVWVCHGTNKWWAGALGVLFAVTVVKAALSSDIEFLYFNF